MSGPCRNPNCWFSHAQTHMNFINVPTGTHWLWEIVSMVINKTSEYDKNHKEVAMMEFRTPEELHALKSPR